MCLWASIQLIQHTIRNIAERSIKCRWNHLDRSSNAPPRAARGTDRRFHALHTPLLVRASHSGLRHVSSNHRATLALPLCLYYVNAMLALIAAIDFDRKGLTVDHMVDRWFFTKKQFSSPHGFSRRFQFWSLFVHLEFPSITNGHVNFCTIVVTFLLPL